MENVSPRPNKRARVGAEDVPNHKEISIANGVKDRQGLLQPEKQR